MLAPDRNTALTTVTASPPMPVVVTSWVRPLGADLPLGCTPSPDPTQPECLDGSTDAGVDVSATGQIAWAQRTPLSAHSSSKPITVAMATAVLGSARGATTCTRTDATAATCTVPAVGGKNGTGSAVQLVTVLTSSWDLQKGGIEKEKEPEARHEWRGPRSTARTAGAERGPGKGVDPINATIAAAVLDSALYTATAAGALEAANAEWWADFWGSASVAIPGDRTLERFYYAHSYLIGSASRADRLAPGLWGPWVHDDSPLWAGDFTLDCKPLACLLT